jgi:hypothetical protein
MKKIQPIIPIPVKDENGDLSVLLPNITYTLVKEKVEYDWVKFTLKVDNEKHIWFTKKSFWLYQNI